MGESWEFVRGCWRQSGYWRRVPWTRKNPTLPQRKARYALGKISHDSVGQTGLVKHGDNDIPVVAHKVSERMKGKRFAPPPAKRVPEVLEGLTPTLVAIGNQVASMRSINKVIPLLLQLQRIEQQRLRKEEEKKKALSLKKKRVL